MTVDRMMAGGYRGSRVAVIGGTGFIGTHLVDWLLATGAHVLVVARHPRDSETAVRPRYRFAACDVRDSGGVSALFEDFRPQLVFHLAAAPDAAETLDYVRECLATNTLGMLNVLNGTVESGSKRFIFADSCKVYGNYSVPYRAGQLADPSSPYAISKAAGWQIAKLVSLRAGLEIVGLRFTFVYGPRQNRNVIRYAQQCVAMDQNIPLQGGNQTRDPIYIDDAVNALLAAGLSPSAAGQSIPVGGGCEITVRNLCQKVLDTLGKSVTIVEGAEELRLTEMYRSVSDNTDAERLLGWTPVVSLDEGLRRTLASDSVALEEIKPESVSSERRLSARMGK